MGASQVLPVDRIIDAVMQVEPFGQRHTDHDLEACKDFVLRDSTRGNQAIAVLPVVLGEDRIGCCGVPKCDVIQRRQPSLNILNIIKNNHALRISNLTCTLQIWSPS